MKFETFILHLDISASFRYILVTTLNTKKPPINESFLVDCPVRAYAAESSAPLVNRE